VQAPAKLFELRSEHRDLESLFKEVSQSHELPPEAPGTKQAENRSHKEGLTNAA